MKYKVGDKAVVRKWNDMAKEYGVDDDGDILVGGKFYFSRAMRVFCGKTVTIVAIKETTHNEPLYEVYGDGNHWHFIAEMLKPVPSSTVTITFNGDTTTATDGEKTATVNGSEEAGAIEAIKKLYHRFPQKGNEYYVVKVRKSGAYVANYIFRNDELDAAYRKSGNLYETEAEAQAIADKINAIFKEEH